jgi:sulfur-oxidizing protein SoxB
VLLSHNGMDIDLKLATRVRGIDAILGGHTHDAVPAPTIVANGGGRTLVTNAGCNGKFLAVLDLDVKSGKVADFRYKLLPVFSNLLPADAAMSEQIAKSREPYKAKLEERLAVTEGLLYRRGNFNGTYDQLLVEGLMSEKNAEIAFSPGFRWGTSLLPGQAITVEHLMDQTAITYPYVTVNELTGETIKTILEDVADNLFNADPYYQQGGDMVRVGGLRYSIDPAREDRRADFADDARRQADRCGEEVQGRGLGAGRRRGEARGRRADLGRDDALLQVAQDHRAPRRVCPADRGRGEEPGMG